MVATCGQELRNGRMWAIPGNLIWIRTTTRLLRVCLIDHVRKLPRFLDHIGFGVVTANHL